MSRYLVTVEYKYTDDEGQQWDGDYTCIIIAADDIDHGLLIKRAIEATPKHDDTGNIIIITDPDTFTL